MPNANRGGKRRGFYEGQFGKVQNVTQHHTLASRSLRCQHVRLTELRRLVEPAVAGFRPRDLAG